MQIDSFICGRVCNHHVVTRHDPSTSMVPSGATTAGTPLNLSEMASRSDWILAISPLITAILPSAFQLRPEAPAATDEPPRCRRIRFDRSSLVAISLTQRSSLGERISATLPADAQVNCVRSFFSLAHLRLAMFQRLLVSSSQSFTISVFFCFFKTVHRSFGLTPSGLPPAILNQNQLSLFFFLRKIGMIERYLRINS